MSCHRNPSPSDYSPVGTNTYLVIPVTVAMINRERQMAVWVLTLMENVEKHDGLPAV